MVRACSFVAFLLLGVHGTWGKLQRDERTERGFQGLDRAVITFCASPARFPKPQWMIEPSSLGQGKCSTRSTVERGLQTGLVFY